MSTTTVSPSAAALSAWFPAIPGFRDRQQIVVDRLLSDRSTLLLMPTGGGKSLTYQLPVLARGGVGLVVSPLIALMREQAAKLQSMGVQTLSLGGLEPRDAQQQLQNFSWSEGPSFILTSPERAETDGYLEYLLHQHRARVTLVTIDEAHCISQWGHNFRPPYKALPGFLDRSFGRGAWPTILCLTATLDRPSEAEVLEDFRMAEESVVRSPDMIRHNLDLRFQRYQDTDEKTASLLEVLEKSKGQKIIVYAHLKQNKSAGTRALAKMLEGKGHKAAFFDADMPLGDRDQVMSDFTGSRIDIVCATGAFGMGIDIPDIRGVVHFLLPESVEQYYQEVGRAGRDGAPAFGLLLYAPKNAQVRKDMIIAGRTSAAKVLSVWSDVMVSGRSEIRSISPAIDFQGHDDTYALFYAFQRAGAIEVLARGPSRLKSFEACSATGAQMLNQLEGATKTGSFIAAFRKLNIEPALGYRKLFNLLSEGHLRMTKSPDSILVFRARELKADEAEKIASDVNMRVDNRLQEFESFRTLIESCDEPSAALKARFGSHFDSL